MASVPQFEPIVVNIRRRPAYWRDLVKKSLPEELFSQIWAGLRLSGESGFEALNWALVYGLLEARGSTALETILRCDHVALPLLLSLPKLRDILKTHRVNLFDVAVSQDNSAMVKWCLENKAPNAVDLSTFLKKVLTNNKSRMIELLAPEMKRPVRGASMHFSAWRRALKTSLILVDVDFLAPPESSNATYLGWLEGLTFEEIVESLHADPNILRRADGNLIAWLGEKLGEALREFLPPLIEGVRPKLFYWLFARRYINLDDTTGFFSGLGAHHLLGVARNGLEKVFSTLNLDASMVEDCRRVLSKNFEESRKYHHLKYMKELTDKHNHQIADLQL